MITVHQNSGESSRSRDSGSDWRTTTVGQIARVKGGKRLPKGDSFSATPTDFPYIRVTDFQDFSVRTKDLKYLRPDTQSRITRYIISAEDVYISIAGTIGLTGIIPAELEGANLTENAAKLVLRSTDIDPAFLMYFLASEQVQREIRSQTVKNAQPKLALARIASLEVRHPSVPEQRKIATVLGLVRRAIDEQQRLLSLTAELKKTLLRQLFTKGLNDEPQKQTEIGPVPQSWDVLRIQDICSLVSGGTPSKQRPEFWSGSIPWVSPKDMKRPRLLEVADHISEEALSDGSSLAPAGAVFVVIRGMILARDVPVALAEVPMAFNQDMKAIIPGPRVQPDFLLYSLVAFKQQLFRRVGRSAHGTMTLMSSEIAQFTIPLPDKHTQQEVTAVIETIELKYKQHQRKHAVLLGLFSTLLEQLMTAQIRLHELDLPDVAVREH